MIKFIKRKFLLILSLLLILPNSITYASKEKVRYNNKLAYYTTEEGKKVKDSYISPNIPMPENLQRYLYRLCQIKDLDYIKTLAIIKHESNFNQYANARGINLGYMQIHKGNFHNLAKKCNTTIAPFDGYVNLNWGTSMLENLYTKFRAEGLSGEALDRAVWSSYNKGEYGFRKTGEATAYINRTKKDINWIKERLGK